MSLLQNIGYILGGFVVIVSIFLIVLAVIEKKLLIKLLRGRYTPNEQYITKISKLDINKPNLALKELDKIAKLFFRDAFHINGNPEYSELASIFYKKNNRKAKEFCESMTRLLYAKETISKKEIQDLARSIAEIVAANRILTKEEKEILDKKAQEKSGVKSKNDFKSKIPFFKKKK